jgi:hypothetical protein
VKAITLAVLILAVSAVLLPVYRVVPHRAACESPKTEGGLTVKEKARAPAYPEPLDAVQLD